MRALRLLLASSMIAAAGACGGAPPSPPRPTRQPPEALGAAHDVCEGSPPLPHAPLSGVLRNARCDQDMYYSMSQVADMLGVDCTHCHAAKVEGKPDREFPRSTKKKEIANWMSSHLMQAIKPADGSPLKCSSCHTDENGKPVAKFLGEPRDRAKANEWMSLVMVKKFVAADGSKLKCKSCHVGAPGTPDFKTTVILASEQIPPHGAPVKGKPAF